MSLKSMDATLFTKYQKIEIKKAKTLSERGNLIGELLLKVNEERVGTKYKPMTAKVMAIKLSSLTLPNLYYLKSICTEYEKQGKSFSKCLFGATKKK